jgi:DNA-binding response OmpR family regulator
VVDDEHSIREITRLTLEVNNYRVLLASDGAEAISVYMQHRDETALVITDIMMPIMNGRALIHALRKLDRGLPILAFSAADRSDPLVGTLDDEGILLVRKPASQRSLLAEVALALRKARFEMERAGLERSDLAHFSI